MTTLEPVAEKPAGVDYQYIRLSVEDRIAIITIDHPPANAFNSQVIKELGWAFDEALVNDEVKVIIITGAGQFFVAGADINEIKSVKDDREAAEAFLRNGHALFLRIEQARKPVIAAINGRFALGGGNELAMACHIRLAEDSVQFGQPEIKLGIMPGWGGTQRLPRIIGKSKALELLLTGDNIKAQEAYRLGLVNKVVPVGSVLREAKRLAKVISMWSALPVRTILAAVSEGMQTSEMAEAVDIEARQFVSLQGSEDMTEGLNAFLEKRRPQFKDK